MSARALAQAGALTTCVEVEEELSVSSKDGRESAWDAVNYATWCVHADARQCLAKFLDYVSSDSALQLSEPKVALVGTLFVAVIADKPGVVDFILSYAKTKWTNSDLRAAAACLAGECSCSDVCCDWNGCYDCSSYPEMDLPFEGTPCVVELAFILNRRELLDILVRFVDGLGERSWRNFFPHHSSLKDSTDLAKQLVCAVSINNEQQVLTLLSQGAHLDPSVCVDERGRSALMHAVLHGNEKLVESLIAAGASVDHIDKLGISVKEMVICANAANLVSILCCDEQGQICEWDDLFALGMCLNNSVVVSKLCDIGREMSIGDSHPIDWRIVVSRGSAEMLSVLMPFVLKMAENEYRSAANMLSVTIECKRADLLPTLLSQGNFFEVACSEVGVHPQNVPMFGTCSAIAARALLGEGVLAGDPDGEEGSALVDAAELEMPAYCSVLLRSGMNKFASAVSNWCNERRHLKADGDDLSFTDQCAVLVEEFFPSLYQLCLAAIRKHLRKPVGDFVDSLPLPMPVKQNLVFV